MGLDLSLTATGAVAYGERAIKSGTFGRSVACPTVQDRVYRYDRMIGDLSAWMNWEKACLVAIEGYSYGSKGQAIYSIAELGGLVRHWLICDLGLPVIEIPPSSLKLFAIGKGGGKGVDKTAVALAVYKRYGVEFPNDNETDAYVLARMAACLVGMEEPQTDFQKRALEKLQLPASIEAPY